MKHILIMIVLFFVIQAAPVFGQIHDEVFVSGGIGISQHVSSGTVGWGMLNVPVYGRWSSITEIDVLKPDSLLVPLDCASWYSCTRVACPPFCYTYCEGRVELKGDAFQLMVNLRTGLGYRIITAGDFALRGITTFGIAGQGTTIRSSYAAGGQVQYQVYPGIALTAVLMADYTPLTQWDFKPKFGLSFAF